jgi:hypothetical protein
MAHLRHPACFLLFLIIQKYQIHWFRAHPDDYAHQSVPASPEKPTEELNR